MSPDRTGSTPTATTERSGETSAVARWRGGWRCDVDAGGFALVVDEPVASGGTGAGPMPTDLLLASLASCYALALAWAARKRGFELPDLEVTATGTYEGPSFAAIAIMLRRVKRAVERRNAKPFPMIKLSSGRQGSGS